MHSEAATFPGSESREDRRLFWWGLGITGVVHLILAAVLATAGDPADLEKAAFPIERRLCDGLRCPAKPFPGERRPLDMGPDNPDVGMIEATVVPKLGGAEPKGGFPVLTKYEQPERIQEAVNVTRDLLDRKNAPLQAILDNAPQIDKRKKNSLASILDAPDDDDPRRRATDLDRIVGQRDGSASGSGTEWKQGNVYAGKVATAVRQQFTVPPFLNEADLRKLRVRVMVTKMNESGQVLAFDVVEKSSNAGFDTAAVQAISRFAPAAGGSAYLPSPDAKTLAYINSNGMLVDLDGALFRK